MSSMDRTLFAALVVMMRQAGVTSIEVTDTDLYDMDSYIHLNAPMGSEGPRLEVVRVHHRDTHLIKLHDPRARPKPIDETVRVVEPQAPALPGAPLRLMGPS